MATTFADPGGDATFLSALTSAGGFYSGTASMTIATDFVHGGHIKSYKGLINSASGFNTTPTGTAADAGGRYSQYWYCNALGAASQIIWSIVNSGGAQVIVQLKITSGGVLQLFEATNQIGSNGATLSTGTWYRISVAWTVATTTSNEFRVFVDHVSSISVSNATITRTGSNRFNIGHQAKIATFDSRFSDIYSDDSNALTDIASDVWVTAKRPNANGTSNQFTTQIGSGGSGYGSGHSPQVNERPLSTTNGWSINTAGQVTEEYNIESASTGDIDISAATIIDYVGWLYPNGVNPEGSCQLLLNSSAVLTFTLPTTVVMFTATAGSTTYPAGSGADIGIRTSSATNTRSLYECGVMVAYNPTAATGHHFLQMMGCS